METLPGVRGAGVASNALMQRLGLKFSAAPPGQRISPDDFLNATMDTVSPTFFGALGIPILSGRSFSEAEAARNAEALNSSSKTDGAGAPPVPVVINEAFAHRIFPHEDPLGKAFGMASPGQIAGSEYVVTGVAGDSRYRSLREELLPIVYAPYRPGDGRPGQFYLYVRTAGPPAGIVSAVRQALHTLDPHLPFAKIYTMRARLTESLWQERLLSALAGVFSLISVVMAGMGLYAMLSYDSSQRTREFGVRSAVGARRLHLVMLLVRELVLIVLPGAVLGLAGCYLLSRVIASALYGVRPLDPVTLLAALGMVGTIGLIAAWPPIRRAMGVDPAVVLREE